MKNNTYIIIVDDSEDDRDFVKDALSKTEKKQIMEFDSGVSFRHEFLNSMSEEFIFHKGIPGLIFLDLRLEEKLSGIELLKEVRESKFLKLVPVIIISGSTDAEDILAAYKNKANLYIIKNDDPAEFTRSIKRIKWAINSSGRLPSDLPIEMIFNP